MCIKLVIKKVLFTYLLLFIGASAFSQLSYTFERLNTESGLLTNTIKGLQFDQANRFLWIASESGIVRYNGHNIQSFGDLNEKSILNNRVVYLTKSEKGTLFGKLLDGNSFIINKNDVDIIQGKTSYNNNLIEYIDKVYNLSLSKFNSIFLSNSFKSFKINNEILSINDGHLYRFKDKKVDLLESFNINSQIFQLGDKLFLIDESNILYEINLINDVIANTTLVKKRKIANYDKYLKKGEKVNVFQDAPFDDPYIIIEKRLCRITYNGNELNFEVVVDDLPYNEYYKFVQFDKVTKTVYMGTENRGVIICRPKYFKRITPSNHLLSNTTSAYAQVLLKNGNIQINDGPIFGSAKENAPTIFDKKADPTTFISSKRILYFNNNDGIKEYDLTKSKILNTSKNEFSIRNIFVEVNDVIYAINEKGVIKRKNLNDWEYLLRFKQAPANFLVFDVKPIKSDELLIASSDGIYKYNLKKNSLKLFFRDKTNASFRSIYKLDNFYLLGSYGAGLYIFKNDTIKKVMGDPNHYLRYPNCFLADENNNIWISTNNGLFSTPVKSVVDFWNFGVDSIKYNYYGKVDGIDVLEMNGGCTPCAIKLPNGNFSIPGIDGLIQFNPNDLNNQDFNIIQPNIFIDRIYINNKLKKLESFKNNLSSKTNNIDIHLGISGMLSEDNMIVEYRYGTDENWNNINIKNPIIHFNNNSFSQHKLYIRCRNTASLKFTTTIIPFYINYPIYLHPLVITTYVLILIFLMFLFVKIKNFLNNQRQIELESEVNLKTKSLLSINKYLQERNYAKDQVLSIVNHDILTPLKYMHITANILKEKIQDASLKKSIDQISITSKELEHLSKNMLDWVKLDSVDKIINKQSFDLHILVQELFEYISPFLGGKDIRLENKIPLNSKLYNSFDALRVLLYNILINSIKSTNAGFVSITLEQLEDGCKIIINDTGIGMDASMRNYLITGIDSNKEIRSPYNKKGNGLGYQIIRYIIKLMDAKILIDSIENKGTTVSIHIKN